jgi:hypothetical protein
VLQSYQTQTRVTYSQQLCSLDASLHDQLLQLLVLLRVPGEPKPTEDVCPGLRLPLRVLCLSISCISCPHAPLRGGLLQQLLVLPELQGCYTGQRDGCVEQQQQVGQLFEGFCGW